MAGKGGRIPGAGRKKGVPNKVTADIKRLAQPYGEQAIKVLADLMLHSKMEATRVAAARELLDRGFGKATQHIDANVSQTIKYDVDLVFGHSLLDDTEHDPAGLTH